MHTQQHPKDVFQPLDVYFHLHDIEQDKIVLLNEKDKDKIDKIMSGNNKVELYQSTEKLTYNR